MKARVIETGDIVDVIPYNRDGFAYSQDDGETVYEFHELEILDDPNYWTRLEHQAAIAAMQGMLNNSLLITGLLKVNKSHEDIVAEVTGTAIRYAHTLVDKMKEERK